MCKSDISFSLFVNIIHWYSLSFSRDKAVCYLRGEATRDFFFLSFRLTFSSFFGAFCEALLVFLDTSHVCELMLCI